MLPKTPPGLIVEGDSTVGKSRLFKSGYIKVSFLNLFHSWLFIAKIRAVYWDCNT